MPSISPRDDLRPVRQEATLLEPLGPHAPAGAVEGENIDLHSAAVEEGEQVTRQRIGLHAVTGNRIQTIERTPHVRRRAAHEYAHLLFGKEHQLLAMVRVMPPGRSRRIDSDASPGVATGMVPRSRKGRAASGREVAPDPCLASRLRHQ